MINISDRNVNGLYPQAMLLLKDAPAYPSRNGPMREMPAPVVSTFNKPTERVLFDATRDCNPFLHFFEALWMLAGRNDLAFLTQFSKNFENFSDDGQTLAGAYGHRWYHPVDQISGAIEMLRKDPMSRRVVTQMWRTDDDFNVNGKDLPCNTAIFWRLRDGELTMTVTNRSNDAVWGLYGANCVHFSMLHEYVAGCLGVAVGSYHHVSNSLHIYPELPVVQRIMANPIDQTNDCLYSVGIVAPFALFNDADTQYDFDGDLRAFFVGKRYGFTTSFFEDVVSPMWEVFMAVKQNNDLSQLLAGKIQASDWRLAVKLWLVRRGYPL